MGRLVGGFVGIEGTNDGTRIKEHQKQAREGVAEGALQPNKVHSLELPGPTTVWHVCCALFCLLLLLSCMQHAACYMHKPFLFAAFFPG